MDKIPEFRIIGGATEEEKSNVREETERRLTDHINSLSEKEREELRKLEYPKSLEELSLIEFFNEETNKLLVSVGLNPYKIHSENYHIDRYPKS